MNIVKVAPQKNSPLNSTGRRRRRRRPSRFRPRDHVPQYSRLLWESVLTPAAVFFFLAGSIALLVGSVAFYMVEVGINPNVTGFLDAVWWGLATVTTVGYGDIVPVTQTGRWIGVGVISTGIICFVGSTALVSTVFFARAELESLGLKDGSTIDSIDERLDDILEELASLRRELADHVKNSKSV